MEMPSIGGISYNQIQILNKFISAIDTYNDYIS